MTKKAIKVVKIIQTPQEMEKELRKLKVHEGGIEIMKNKAPALVMILPEILGAKGLILKQEMLSIGGDAALPGDALKNCQSRFPAMLIGSFLHFDKLSKKLKKQVLGLEELSKEIEEGLEGCFL